MAKTAGDDATDSAIPLIKNGTGSGSFADSPYALLSPPPSDLRPTYSRASGSPFRSIAAKLQSSVRAIVIGALHFFSSLCRARFVNG